MLRALPAGHLAALVLASLFGAGCAWEPPGGAQPLDASASPVIYGVDSRLEFFEPPAEELRRLARSSTLAVFRRSSLDGAGPEGVRVMAPGLREARGLCEGARFADQPSAAVCSGVLVDDDLLLVAGHCIEAEASCADLLFAAGYYYDAPGELHALRPDDVFACRRIAYFQADGEDALDAAFIQLDRPATPSLLPVVLGAGSPSPGDPVVAIGYGEGLPGKIDVEGRWLGACAAGGACAEAQIDAFTGLSGGGVFDALGALAGIVVSGRQDYDVSEDGCLTARVEPASEAKGEKILVAARAVQSLCEQGWPSERLCGRAGACGDAVCAPGEDASSCPVDCRAAACGDGRCEADEWRTCSPDCPPTPPGHWLCPSSWYGEGTQCDCTCMAPDPDCFTGECEPGGESPPGEAVTPEAPARDAGACSLGGAQRSSAYAILAGGLLALRRARRRARPRASGSCPRGGPHPDGQHLT
ncbi:trypsin-like peptidase domain-containing protein [Sorangium sp. So ce1000]|uniref:trypsin-like peptidase domain-containing protein n=1 Tax=Sorangium sp. So ce1000 TaxID=3133325 RepID=UPI003F6169A4